jgi:hypothetical protein
MLDLHTCCTCAGMGIDRADVRWGESMHLCRHTGRHVYIAVLHADVSTHEMVLYILDCVLHLPCCSGPLECSLLPGGLLPGERAGRERWAALPLGEPTLHGLMGVLDWQDTSMW